MLPGLSIATAEFGAILKQNQFLQAFLLPTIVSLLSLLCYQFYNQFDAVLRKRFFRSVTIKNQDENYNLVMNFISKHCKIQSQELVAETFKKKNKTWKEYREEWMTGQVAKAKFAFRPSDSKGSISIFYFKNRRIMMTRLRGNTVTIGYDRQPLDLESTTLTVFGQSNQILLDLLSEAIDDAAEEAGAELSIWVTSNDSWFGGWEKCMSRRPRSKESVILDQNKAEQLLEDARTFLKSSEWYGERGIPYRRGYLLYGPPGTGKTSFVQVLAGELKLDLCMLSLSDGSLTDNKLAGLLRDAPKRSVIMLEDVDSVFTERKKVGNNEKGITFSGLLNALDGVASQEGRMLIMTTNHLERLDPALIRPGRVDVRCELKNASKSQAGLLFTRFFENADEEMVERFTQKIPEDELSMAQLQGHLLSYRDDARGAISSVEEKLLKRKGDSKTSLDIEQFLKRAGLSKFSYAFHAYGFHFKSDVEDRGLTVEVVKDWCAELNYDSEVQDRMKKLLSKDDELMRECLLVDAGNVKEWFFRTYPAGKQAEVESLISVLIDGETGRGRVSIWELRNHLGVYFYDSLLAIEKAVELVALSTSSSGAEKWMTTFEFCKRGSFVSDKFRDLYWSLEEDGKTFVRDIMHLKSEDEVQKLGFDTGDISAARSIIDVENKSLGGCTHYRELFASCGFRQSLWIFRSQFGESAHARAFAHAITDACGFGLASVGNVMNYVESGDNAGEVADGAFESLVAVKRVREETPVVEVKKKQVFVETWLEEIGLTEYSDSFLEQEIKDLEDILLPKPITEGQLLSVLNVTKLGHRKKILQAIEKLGNPQ